MKQPEIWMKSIIDSSMQPSLFYKPETNWWNAHEIIKNFKKITGR